MNNDRIGKSGISGLLDLIGTSNNIIFTVPIYQRTYKWGLPQIQKFYQDYLSIKNSSDDDKRKHFLGMIIYYTIERDNNLFEKFIIDGQQRLITTFLFLLAFRKVLETKNLGGGWSNSGTEQVFN